MSRKSKTPLHLRQGDVLLRAVEKLPDDVKRVPGGSKYVLAEGEATGHVHAIEDTGDVALYEREDSELWVEVEKPSARLSHPEHLPIDIPAGLYAVVRQREYSTEGEGAVYVYD